MRFEPPDRVMVPPTPALKLPILSVPTTMGCAECSRGGGEITDHHLGRKLSLAGEGVPPRTVLIDGQALVTTPRKLLVSTAIGQLRIAIETVYSTEHNPLGDGMALHAIRLLFAYLPQYHGGTIDTLLTTKTACVMASLASFGGPGLNTATCHHVGGLYHVPQGEANAMRLLVPYLPRALHSLERMSTPPCQARGVRPCKEQRYRSAGWPWRHQASGRRPSVSWPTKELHHGNCIRRGQPHRHFDE
jgi:alcohol dehydrogenase class IV